MKKIDYDTDSDFDFEKPTPLNQSLLLKTEKIIAASGLGLQPGAPGK